MAADGIRVALYSPGMVGLGHLRRNLLLVRRFSAVRADAAWLVLAEAHEAGSFGFPDSVDCITLPSLRKDADGCEPRRLALELADVVRLRARVLEAALLEFAPDVLIVDHLPLGALGELASVLPRLRAECGTRLVLGLRDILEQPEVVRAEWTRAGHLQAVRELYEAVWIYGDPRVFDPTVQYGWPAEVCARVEFSGYLDPVEEPERARLENADCLATQLLRNERVIVCQVGGGQDGQRLATAFADADLPPDATGVLLTGPFMPRTERERLARRCAERPGRRHVLSLIGEPSQLLAHAERVITMGGYNSVLETLSLGTPALVVPRVQPRREQHMRAQRFAELGLIDMLEPERLDAAALSAWMAAPVPPRRRAQDVLDMDGLGRATGFLDSVLAGTWATRASPAHGAPSPRRAIA